MVCGMHARDTGLGSCGRGRGSLEDCVKRRAWKGPRPGGAAILAARESARLSAGATGAGPDVMARRLPEGCVSGSVLHHLLFGWEGAGKEIGGVKQ